MQRIRIRRKLMRGSSISATFTGVKLYLTVNTLLKEQEMEKLYVLIWLLIYEHGLDAAIVQDFGVASLSEAYSFRIWHLHASTQMTVPECGQGQPFWKLMVSPGW